MSTLRYDVTTGDWLVFAAERATRPNPLHRADAGLAQAVAHDPACPFCVGNEHQSPADIDTEPDPSDPARWSVRLFENKYPALRPDCSPERRLHGSLFRDMQGHGRHEVLVESPHHSLHLAEQPIDQVVRVLRVLHRRCRALASDPRLEVVQIFKNHGAEAGSSLPHPHFQLIATPIVPRQIRIKFQMAVEYYNVAGRSVYVDLTEAEVDARSRLVADNSSFVAFAPYASRAPYEVWIVPRTPVPTFDLAAPECLPALAELLVDVLRRLRAAVGDAPFNLVVNSAPRRHADEPDFVWHVEIVPRLTRSAGFELATGMSINSVMPELAAEHLRGVAPTG